MNELVFGFAADRGTPRHEVAVTSDGHGFFAGCVCGWSRDIPYSSHGVAVGAYLRLHTDHIPVRELI